MRAKRPRAQLRTGARVVVEHPGVRNIEHLVAVAPHPLAPVDILEVEEVALVHEPDVARGAAPDQHRRAENPVDGARVGVVPVGHHVVAQAPTLRDERAEGDPSQEERPPIVEAPGRELKRPVRIQELRG